MTTYLLIAHVFIGLIGVGASYAVLLGLYKKQLNVPFLLWTSVVAFVAYVATHLIGGFYYDEVYQAGISSLVREGPRPWIDLFFMEAKGRLFLFLPILSGAISAVLYGYGAQLAEDTTLRGAVIKIALVTFLIGVFVTLAGVVISGGAA